VGVGIQIVVGPETHQRGHHRLEEAHPAQHGGKDVLAHALDDEAEHKAEREDKDEDQPVCAPAQAWASLCCGGRTPRGSRTSSSPA